MEPNSVYKKKLLPKNVQKIGFLLTAVGLIFGLLSYLIDAHFAMSTYLFTYAFLVSIAVGGMLLFALEYVVGAEWSVPIRRVIEVTASLVPVLLLLVIPLLLHIKDLFHWAHNDVVQNDAILKAKSPYLNIQFFIIRAVGSVLLWYLFYFFMTKNSRKQDETGDQNLTKKNIRLGAIFIPVFAITITMNAIDWIMSLEPHWYSTIFGVYFFAGSVLASLSVVTIATVLLRENGYLHPEMVDDHYFSLGALLFAFINFWAYIAFSQYLLIWYANLPEETFWLLHRWEGGWIVVSLALIIIHFVVPYAVLLSQPAKMDPKRLKFVAVWILFAHFIDLYWLVMPNMHAEKFSILSIILQFAFPTAAVGVLVLVFYYGVNRQNMVPVGDPKLKKGLKFRL
ncbi:MAG: quinol:cytochrome C oxidoreductase [Ignavibacteria bacterium]|nr:quinol:cytochrome C oxidoreductase [Ignavibacteria bacterium]